MYGVQIPEPPEPPAPKHSLRAFDLSTTGDALAGQSGRDLARLCLPSWPRQSVPIPLAIEKQTSQGKPFLLTADRDSWAQSMTP
jgi:hypothetical protein